MTGAATGGATGVASLEPPMRSRILPSPPETGTFGRGSDTVEVHTSGVTSIGVGVPVDGAGAAPRKVPEISVGGGSSHPVISGVIDAQRAGLSGAVRSVRGGVSRSEVAGVAPSMTILVSGIESKEISPPISKSETPIVGSAGAIPISRAISFGGSGWRVACASFSSFLSDSKRSAIESSFLASSFLVSSLGFHPLEPPAAPGLGHADSPGSTRTVTTSCE